MVRMPLIEQQLRLLEITNSFTEINAKLMRVPLEVAEISVMKIIVIVKSDM